MYEKYKAAHQNASALADVAEEKKKVGSLGNFLGLRDMHLKKNMMALKMIIWVEAKTGVNGTVLHKILHWSDIQFAAQ